VALAANVAVTVATLVSGLESGSAAVLAEAAHSLADSANLGFLSSRSRWRCETPRRSSRSAPAACGFSGHAVRRAWTGPAAAALRAGEPGPERQDDPVRGPAAIGGIAIALAGIVTDQLTGSSVFDPATSIAIGLLLTAVAVWIARDTSELLVGASARPDERSALDSARGEFEEIEKVFEALTTSGVCAKSFPTSPRCFSTPRPRAAKLRRIWRLDESGLRV
jgi:hypothetical protein